MSTDVVRALQKISDELKKTNRILVEISGVVSSQTDISQKGIKYLRRVAEKESRCKCTGHAVTPLLQVTFGDVQEATDMTKICSHIQELMKDEINRGDATV